MLLGMLKSDVLRHYGTPTAVAKTLGISQAAVSLWKELIPPAAAYELAKKSDGALSFNPDLYKESSLRHRKLAEILSTSA